jgi:acyl-CoA thioesterase
MAGGTTFDAETALRPGAEPGVFEGDISETWWIERGPNGGYIAVLLLRAMIETVADPARRPRSLTIHFLESAAAGPCRVAVAVERAGRGVTTLSAHLTQGDRTCAIALAAFATPRASLTLSEAVPPPTLPPEESPPFAPVEAGFPGFTQHYDYRWAVGDPPFSGSRSSRVGGWMRLAEPRPADALLVAAFADAWMPCIFPRLAGPVGAPTVDLTVHFRADLPLPTAAPDDWYLCAFSSRLGTAGFFEEDGEVWSRDGVLLAQSRQLAMLPSLRE